MKDAPLARALQLVEALIAKRLTDLHAQAAQPEISPEKAGKLHQRADELGVLIREIRRARYGAEAQDLAQTDTPV